MIRSIGGAFEMEVLVHGRTAQTYLHKGLAFIEGRRGSEFTIRVRNNTARRVCVVLSVDGLSVMNGKVASRDDAGYIIGQHSYVDIPGWRLNDKDVASFYFADLPEAYAAQMDKPTNIGVIGAAIYYEKQSDPHFLLRRGEIEKKIFRGSYGSPTLKGIGTGFGRRQEHEVIREHFNRESFSVATLEIRYDDKEGLERRGIVLGLPHYQGDRVISANPFPEDTGCKPPSGWKG